MKLPFGSHGSSTGESAGRLSLVAVAAVSILLGAGHAIGGVAGLIEGYKLTLEFIFHKPASSPFSTALNDLKEQYRSVKTQLHSDGRVDFHPLKNAFEYFKRHYAQNPNTYYFEAEISRIEDSKVFDGDGCLKTAVEGIRNLEEETQRSHGLFYAYLEAVAHISESKMGMDQNACYSDESGTCVQRKAWVNHLLAADFYILGLNTPDATKASAFFNRASGHALAAAKYKHNGTTGFAQCIDTAVLQKKLEDKIGSLRNTPTAVTSSSQ